MSQVLHILRKDVRYLRWELVLFVVLAALLAWFETHSTMAWWTEALVPVAGAYLVVRLIQAEALCGENQFWLTRPYSRTSLAGAKALFVLVFVIIPLMAAQAAILIMLKLPVPGSLPGAVWSQVLVLLCVALPVAAVASLTRGFSSSLFAVFAVATIALMVYPTLWTLGLVSRMPAPVESTDWVRHAFGVSAAAAISGLVLYLQYRYRRTGLSRTLAVMGLLLAGPAYLYFPAKLALAVQLLRSKQPTAAESVRVTVEPRLERANRFRQSRSPQLIVPIRIEGLPAGTDVRAEALAATIRDANGRMWDVGLSYANRRTASPEATVLNWTLTIPETVFNRLPRGPVEVHGSVWLTIFGNARSKTFQLSDRPVDVMDGLQCNASVFRFETSQSTTVWCRSAYRWPSRLLYVTSPQLGTEALYSAISFSPFPAGLTFQPVEAHWVTGPSVSKPIVTITSKEPIAHLRRELVARDVRLDDFVGMPVLRQYP
jgi:hypothetical protein